MSYLEPVTIEIMMTPPSLNAQLQSSGARFKYWRTKKQWGEMLRCELTDAEFPAGLERVTVEAEFTFPDRRRRDEGNYRFFVEKALGDTLTRGGWIADDDYTRYSFGACSFRYEKGVRRVRLTLFPMEAAA